jgi:hypothetical protein
MSERPGRSWGYWTLLKLAILADYLPAFLTASSGRASEFVYLDAFAGEGRGLDRLTGEEFHGSARIALEVTETGGFTRLRYFEQASKARELEEKFRAEYPNRDIKVYGGDCNEQIPRALDDLRSVRWAPTFAFIDPDGMEFEWTALEILAAHQKATARLRARSASTGSNSGCCSPRPGSCALCPYSPASSARRTRNAPRNCSARPLGDPSTRPARSARSLRRKPRTSTSTSCAGG